MLHGLLGDRKPMLHDEFGYRLKLTCQMRRRMLPCRQPSCDRPGRRRSQRASRSDERRQFYYLFKVLFPHGCRCVSAYGSSP